MSAQGPPGRACGRAAGATGRAVTPARAVAPARAGRSALVGRPAPAGWSRAGGNPDPAHPPVPAVLPAGRPEWSEGADPAEGWDEADGIRPAKRSQNPCSAAPPVARWRASRSVSRLLRSSSIDGSGAMSRTYLRPPTVPAAPDDAVLGAPGRAGPGVP